MVVEAALSERFQGAHAIDEAMRKNMECISAERANMLAARTTLLDLKRRAAQWRAAAIDERREEFKSEAERFAFDIANRLHTCLHGPDLRLYLNGGDQLDVSAKSASDEDNDDEESPALTGWI